MSEASEQAEIPPLVLGRTTLDSSVRFLDLFGRTGVTPRTESPLLRSAIWSAEVDKIDVLIHYRRSIRCSMSTIDVDLLACLAFALAMRLQARRSWGAEGAIAPSINIWTGGVASRSFRLLL